MVAGNGRLAVVVMQLLPGSLTHTSKTEKFDPDRKYIRQWVPEFESSGYPKPMVDHSFARDRVLAAYKEALGSI